MCACVCISHLSAQYAGPFDQLKVLLLIRFICSTFKEESTERDNVKGTETDREREREGVGLIDMRNSRIKNFRHMKRLRLLLL